VISLLAAVFAALLLPQFTREWQDRQREREIKQGLLREISIASTTAVRHAISFANGQVRAAGAEPGDGPGEIYAGLRNSWLIERGSAHSAIITYFPALDSCWYSYERVIADYLGLPVQPPSRRDPRLSGIRRYLEDFRTSYVDKSATACLALRDLPVNVQTRYGSLKTRLDENWNALDLPTTSATFRGLYEVLGEALLIGKETVIASIAASEAKGFSHGVSLRSVLPG
jgi:hypothetical protein